MSAAKDNVFLVADLLYRHQGAVAPLFGEIADERFPQAFPGASVRSPTGIALFHESFLRS